MSPIYQVSRFEGKVAIVTGGGRGIGKACALRLASDGTDVVVADIDLENAGQTASDIIQMGRKALAVAVDVSSIESIESLVEKTVGEFGRIDILVNVAGIVQNKLFLDMTEEDWNRVIDVNQKGTAFCTKLTAAQMVKQVPDAVKREGKAGRSYGKIVNFSSISGRRGRELQLHYAASKAAIISITQSAALALAPYNINVNAIAPGVVMTPMWEQNEKEKSEILGMSPGKASQAFIDRTPLKRAGTPEDMAAVVSFLCSSDSDLITGQTINVDGGYEMD